jgi:small-conductance mechanosensitive channel
MSKATLHFIPQWVPDWLIAIVGLALTVLVAAAILGIVRMIVRRLLPKDRTLTHSVLKDVGGIAQLALTLLVAQFITPALPLDRHASNVIANVMIAAFIVMMGWIAIIAADLAINRYVNRFHSDTKDNLLARKAVTQMRVLKRTIDVTIGVIAAGFALMTFPAVHQFGVSLFASAGIAGIAVGFAAKPLLENLVAGIQLAITQPFRIDDVVIINGEYGWVEEISSTYVVIRCWDWRRLIVPLSWVMTNPIQNWTRTGSQIIGSAFLFVDYTADAGRIRAKAEEIAKASPLWDKNVVNTQVIDVSEYTMKVRVLVTASDSGKTSDLCSEMREKLIGWMREEYPEALPRRRTEAIGEDYRQMPQARRA